MIRKSCRSLVDEGGDYGVMERYLLQPVKSVVMPVTGKARKTTDSDDFTWTINGDPMPVVKEATHMGIKRSAISNEPTIEENIKKARKTMYSLMGPGCMDTMALILKHRFSFIRSMCYRL